MPRRKHTPDDLFLLVKSLTKSEKRYFKIHAAADRAGTNYMQLFDLLNEQEEYDEAKFKEALKGKMRVRNFHVTKKYLFDLILKTLMNFYAEDSIDIKIKQQILKIDILNRKGLFDVTYKQLKQIEKLARKYDKHIYLNEVYALMKNNVVEMLHRRYSEKDVAALQKREQENFAQVENKRLYKNLLLEVFRVQIQFMIQSREAANAKLKALIAHPLLQHESSATTFDSKIIFNNINSYLHKETGNPLKSEIYFKRYLALLESKPHILKYYKGNYISGIYNYAILLRELKKYGLMRNTLLKAINIKAANASEELLHFRNYYRLMLACCIDTGNYQDALLLEEEILAGFRKHKGKLDKVSMLIIQYYLAYTHLKKGNYDVASRMLAEIISTPKSEVSLELVLYARLLQWICHYESGDHDTLDYLAQSLMRFISSNGLSNTPESLLVRSLFLQRHLLDDLESLRKFKAELTEKYSREAYKISDYFDITAWVQMLIRFGKNKRLPV